MIKKFNRIEEVIVNGHLYQVQVDKNDEICWVKNRDGVKHQRVNETLYGRPFNAELVTLIVERYVSK